MMGHVVVKSDVSFARIAPAGFRLLGAIELTARRFGAVLMITCGCEAHPPTDPHSLGEAYDVRTHTLPDEQKVLVLKAILIDAGGDTPADVPVAAAGGFATAHFWGWIESPGQPTEHLHVQRRHGTVYP
jgi:hypothetical protein